MLSLIACGTRAFGQQTVAAEARAATGDVRTEELLTRRVTVNMDSVSLQRIVTALARSAQVPILYRVSILDGVKPLISLHIANAPLGVALDRVLVGTNLHAVAEDNAITIKPMSDKQGMDHGVVAGTVTDAKTGQHLRGVSVTLDDSAGTVRTNEVGYYRFANVVPGSHKISVRFVGYARQMTLITVVEGQSVTANFALASSVNALDQVVVTATGAQRYRELGHVVTQLNADSLVREAPITSVSELLTARVPGLQVMGTNGGSVGGEVALRIRGTTTTSLDPQPIVIVDGVRYKNTNSVNGAEDSRPFNAEPRSPLNDLNVNDIETVEVVKGPSASTLYGPDAANGVIVITTKRGHAGKAQWHVYAYPDLSTLSVGSQGGQLDRPMYQGWGHVPGTNELYAGQCTRLLQAAQQCVLDSLVVVPPSPNNPQTSVVAKERPQWHSGLSVNGGTSALSYFFSGNWDSQTGMLRLPADAVDVLKSQLGVHTLEDAIRNPNTQQALSLHTNVSTAPTPTSNITFVGNYTQATQRAIDVNLLYNSYTRGPLSPGVSYTAQDSINQLINETNAPAFLSTTQMDVRRLTAALNGTVQVRGWLTLNGSVGNDLDNTIDRGIRPDYTLSGGNSASSAANDDRRANTNRNAHIGATANTRTGAWSARTSLGVDYSYTNLDGLNTSGSNLAPGSSDLSTASSQSVSRVWTEMVQLGGYGEEVIGWRDRLFVTGSLRLDGSTTFGDAYRPRPFPKAGISWVISDEPFLRAAHTHGVDELRLRYSYGAASRYPTSAMKWGAIQVINSSIENRTATEFDRYQGANPDLQPERSRESEYGLDATVWSNVQLGLTWYSRHTDDELQYVSEASGMLAGFKNVGDLAAHGFEFTANARVLEVRNMTLNLNFSYAYQADKVLSLGSATEYKSYEGSYAVGYPLGAAFGTRTIGYVDSAGGGPDGFITPSEVVSSPQQYLGTSFPPRTYTFTPIATLLNGRLRVSTLFDRQSGGVLYNSIGACIDVRCAATFLKSTPLLEQARNLGTNFGDRIQSSDFTRWRELTVTADLPTSWRQRVHLSRASASVQIRNLAIWTPSTAPDPESQPGLGTVAAGLIGNGNGANGIPMPRSWTLRVDIAP